MEEEAITEEAIMEEAIILAEEECTTTITVDLVLITVDLDSGQVDLDSILVSLIVASGQGVFSHQSDLSPLDQFAPL